MRRALTIALLLLSSVAVHAAGRPESFPSNTRTAWMTPEAFHISVGMTEKAAREVLKQNQWKTEPGKEKNHLIVPYDESKTLTLVFEKGILVSARFELVAFVPDVKAAFEEERKTLREKLGPPKGIQTGAGFLIYDKIRPNVMVVMSIDRTTRAGKQGVGFLVVRYFLP